MQNLEQGPTYIKQLKTIVIFLYFQFLSYQVIRPKGPDFNSVNFFLFEQFMKKWAFCTWEYLGRGCIIIFVKDCRNKHSLRGKLNFMSSVLVPISYDSYYEFSFLWVLLLCRAYDLIGKLKMIHTKQIQIEEKMILIKGTEVDCSEEGSM